MKRPVFFDTKSIGNLKEHRIFEELDKQEKKFEGSMTNNYRAKRNSLLVPNQKPQNRKSGLETETGGTSK